MEGLLQGVSRWGRKGEAGGGGGGRLVGAEGGGRCSEGGGETCRGKGCMAMHTQWFTYKRCKRVHGEAGTHHNQQICFGKVCLHLLKKPRWQALPKENYVRLDKTLCNARLVNRV